MADILMLFGVNLNMLGKREPVYGTDTLEDVSQKLCNVANELGATLEIMQTNFEGEAVERIHKILDDGTKALVINPGAWTHYSYALRDALSMLKIPIVEVHFSNIQAREEFRKHSVISAVCKASICGLGTLGHELAIKAAFSLINEKNN